MSKIVYAPQFKDLVLESLTSDYVLTKEIASRFPSHCLDDTRTALRVLRRFGAADYKKITTREGPKYLWRRV